MQHCTSYCACSHPVPGRGPATLFFDRLTSTLASSQIRGLTNNSRKRDKYNKDE